MSNLVFALVIFLVSAAGAGASKRDLMVEMEEISRKLTRLSYFLQSNHRITGDSFQNLETLVNWAKDRQFYLGAALPPEMGEVVDLITAASNGWAEVAGVLGNHRVQLENLVGNLPIIRSLDVEISKQMVKDSNLLPEFFKNPVEARQTLMNLQRQFKNDMAAVFQANYKNSLYVHQAAEKWGSILDAEDGRLRKQINDEVLKTTQSFTVRTGFNHNGQSL